MRIVEAQSWRERLSGLAFRRELDQSEALLIPRCRSVHTFGMRFALDVVFLDEHDWVLEVRHHVPPRRVLWCRGARAALETRAGESWRFVRGGRLVR